MGPLRALMPLLLAALTGCGLPSSQPPHAVAPDAVSRSSEEDGKFLAFVGPRRQHDPPFLGVVGTNFDALRSWIDTRNGETAHQLYVEDSYFGAARTWEKARNGHGGDLKFIAISMNEITCAEGCSYAEEFAAALPEALLRASPDGLAVTFTAKSGAAMTIPVPGELIQKQLAAVDAARASLPAATAK